MMRSTTSVGTAGLGALFKDRIISGLEWYREVECPEWNGGVGGGSLNVTDYDLNMDDGTVMRRNDRQINLLLMQENETLETRKYLVRDRTYLATGTTR